MPSPTIKDIARAVGVAHSTVSRALNGDSRISLATRQRVLRAAAELGYSPNLSARGLVRGQVLSIGLVIPEVVEAFFGRIVHGADQVTFDEGFNLVLYVTHADVRREMAALEQVGKGRVDGMILMIRKLKEEAIRNAARAGVPLVMLMRSLQDAAVDTVRVENEDGAYRAVQHLTQLGHRRIAFISGYHHAQDSRERLRGYRRALRDAGIPFRRALVMRGDFRESGGSAAAERLLSLPPAERPTAIFAANDRMALGVMDRLARSGVRVPDEVSVIGFDDIEQASYARPALTTVRQPVEEVGRAAARRLIDRIRGRECQERDIVLQTELVIRASCAAAARPPIAPRPPTA
ncbi:MAG TPA: LacI family DNA-binding transcriptional regulator [Limnochordia bacterium]